MYINKYIYTFTPHSFTFKIYSMSVIDYNNFKSGVITPSISQRGQRAHEDSSRGRGRSEEKRKSDYSARRASRHLAQRLGERENKNKL